MNPGAIIVAVLTGLGTWAAFDHLEGHRAAIHAAAGLGWLASAAMIGIPYTRKWGGSFRDALFATGMIWLLLTLPSFPLPVAERLRPLPFLFAAGYATFLSLIAKGQGRYAYTDRRFPDLEGEPRVAAQAILERAGLRPVALLVAPFVTYNAFVQGLRTCVVVVDRRASQELPAIHLQALLAHEAGHLRKGDMFRYLSIPTVAVTLAVLLFLVHGNERAVVPVALALMLALGPAVVQRAELMADRFAADLVGSAEVGRMLVRIHADRPIVVERAASAPLLGAFLSHPPLDVRLARLGLEHGRIPVRYGVGRIVRILLGLAPAVAAVGPWPAPLSVLWGPAIVAGLLYAAPRILVARAARRSFAYAYGKTSAFRWGRLLLAVGALMLIAAGAIISRVDRKFRAAPLVLISAACLGVLILAKNRKQAGKGLDELPAQTRRAVVEALAAVSEGQPQRGLQALEALSEDARKRAWCLAAKGICLLHAGRTEEARADLQAAMAADPRLMLPAVWLATLHVIGGDAGPARNLMAGLCESSPSDPMLWRIKGLVHREAREFDLAWEASSKAVKLKPADAGALADLALTAMDQGRPDGEVEGLLAQAEAAGPRSPAARLARARRLVQTGKREEAARSLKEAIDLLGTGEYKIWVPYYESLGRRWGIPESNSPHI